MVQLVKYYNTRKEDRVVNVSLPFLVCPHSVRECAGDVSCLREQGVQSYANTYVDRQGGMPIKMLRPISCNIFFSPLR